MKSLLITASLLLAGNVGARLGTTLEHRSLQGGDEPVDVLVRYKTGRGRSAIQANSKRIYSQFAKFNTVAASVPSYNLQALADDPDIVFIEEDYTLYKNGESTPFGIELTQGLSTVIPRNFESSACNDPNSFKIGIIDSGLSISHPDSPCGPSDNPSNCQGKVFGLEGFNWYDPIDEHGTHVAGTIGAIGGNNLGVRGMIQDAAVCYLIARVFGDDPSGTTKTSSVVAAVEWLEIQGAKVISMSLGGAFRSEALGEAIADAYANDVLVIASAGNDGETTLNYPASFAGVISVAAVDEDLQRAVFSQYNSGVDITAPGVGILSTVPLGSGSVGAVSFGNFAINGEYLRYSVEPKADGVSGILVECPDLGRNTCPGAGGHICLIKR
jgi:subtilisin family serine protease